MMQWPDCVWPIVSPIGLVFIVVRIVETTTMYLQIKIDTGSSLINNTCTHLHLAWECSESLELDRTIARDSYYAFAVAALQCESFGPSCW